MIGQTKPLVKNAGDPEQVKKGSAIEDQIRRRQLNDLREVLALPSGRRLLWRQLEKAKVFSSVWDPSARIHFNAGQQDFGHWIMSEIVEADENAFTQMMLENKKKNENGGL